jgi:spermidine synthase
VTLGSIVPFCLALGYLTPSLIDAYSGGNPSGAGRSYAVNIAGGIVGPLFAAYILLPTIGTRVALLVLSLPMLLLFVLATRQGASARDRAAIRPCICILDVRQPRIRGWSFP